MAFWDDVLQGLGGSGNFVLPPQPGYLDPGVIRNVGKEALSFGEGMLRGASHLPARMLGAPADILGLLERGLTGGYNMVTGEQAEPPIGFSSDPLVQKGADWGLWQPAQGTISEMVGEGLVGSLLPTMKMPRAPKGLPKGIDTSRVGKDGPFAGDPQGLVEFPDEIFPDEGLDINELPDEWWTGEDLPITQIPYWADNDKWQLAMRNALEQGFSVDQAIEMFQRFGGGGSELMEEFVKDLGLRIELDRPLDLWRYIPGVERKSDMPDPQPSVNDPGQFPSPAIKITEYDPEGRPYIAQHIIGPDSPLTTANYLDIVKGLGVDLRAFSEIPDKIPPGFGINNAFYQTWQNEGQGIYGRPLIAFNDANYNPSSTTILHEQMSPERLYEYLQSTEEGPRAFTTLAHELGHALDNAQTRTGPTTLSGHFGSAFDLNAGQDLWRYHLAGDPNMPPGLENLDPTTAKELRDLAIQAGGVMDYYRPNADELWKNTPVEQFAVGFERYARSPNQFVQKFPRMSQFLRKILNDPRGWTSSLVQLRSVLPPALLGALGLQGGDDGGTQ